jgi:hypothetical protein
VASVLHGIAELNHPNGKIVMFLAIDRVSKFAYVEFRQRAAERMSRTVKEAAIRIFHYGNIESLKPHVLSFVTAYNSPSTSKR